MLKPNKVIALTLAMVFIANLLLSQAWAAMLPQPNQLVGLSQNYSLPTLRGLKINPKNPLNMEFIIDPGTDGKIDSDKASLLIKYFLAALTIPQENLWVNLSTYENTRIIPAALSQTDLGADMLAQDYILKQVASSITYPETETGKRYWDTINNVGARSSRPGQGNPAPTSSFNKIWITAKKAKVYEGNNTVIIVDSKLNAMMDRDYLAISKNTGKTSDAINRVPTPNNNINVFKQTILPKIEKDINEGKNFANLRQIYNAVILGMWFKNKFKESFYKSYLNKDNVKGIDTADKQAKDKIYNLYVEAFTKGVYNYAKKDYNLYAHKITRRQYYSGGMAPGFNLNTTTPIEATTDGKEVAPITGQKVVSVNVTETPNGLSSISETLTGGYIEKMYHGRLLAKDSIAEYVKDLAPIAREYGYRQLYLIYKGTKKYKADPTLVFRALTKMRRLLIGKNDLPRLGNYLINLGNEDSDVLLKVANEEAFTDEIELYEFTSKINPGLSKPGLSRPQYNQYEDKVMHANSKQGCIRAIINIGDLGDSDAIRTLFFLLSVRAQNPRVVNAPDWGTSLAMVNLNDPADDQVVLAITQALTKLKVPQGVVESFILSKRAQETYNTLTQVSKENPTNQAVINKNLLRLTSLVQEYPPAITWLNRYVGENQNNIGLHDVVSLTRATIKTHQGQKSVGEFFWGIMLNKAWKVRWGRALTDTELTALWHAHDQIAYQDVKGKLAHVKELAPDITADQRAWLIAHQWLGSGHNRRNLIKAMERLSSESLDKKLDAIKTLGELGNAQAIPRLFSELKKVAGDFMYDQIRGKISQPADQKELQAALQTSLEQLGIGKEELIDLITDIKIDAYLHTLKTDSTHLKERQFLNWLITEIIRLGNLDNRVEEKFLAFAESLRNEAAAKELGKESLSRNIAQAVVQAADNILKNRARRDEYLAPLTDAWRKEGEKKKWNPLTQEQRSAIWHVHATMSRGWHRLTEDEKKFYGVYEPGQKINYGGRQLTVYRVHTDDLAVTYCTLKEIKQMLVFLKKSKLFNGEQIDWLMYQGWLGEEGNRTDALTSPRLLNLIFEIDQAAGHDPAIRPKGYTRHMQEALRLRNEIMSSGNIKFEELYVVNLIDQWFDQWANYPAKNKIEAILKARLSESLVTEKAQRLRESGILKEVEIGWLLENKFLGEDENGHGGNSSQKKNPGALALVPDPAQNGGLTWTTTGIEKYGTGNFYFENIPDLKTISSMGFVINSITSNKTIGQFLN